MREAAIVAIKTLLEGISVSNGYTLDIKVVKREFESIDTLPDQAFPCVIIEDDGEEVIEWKTGGFADVTFELNLIGYVSHATALSTALNELDVAVKKAIGSDDTLSGTVVSLLIKPYTERSGTQFAPYGFFVRPIEITYEGTLAGGL